MMFSILCNAANQMHAVNWPRESGVHLARECIHVAERNPERELTMEDEKPKPVGMKEKKGAGADPKPMDIALGSAEVLAKGYEQCVTLTCEQVGRRYPAAADKLSELADFGKGNLNTWLLAGSQAARGWESLSAEVMGYNKKIWDDNMKRAEALLGCKSFEEVVSPQLEAVMDQLNTFLEEGSKLGEMTATAARAAVEPINQWLGAAADEVTKPIAA